MVVISIIAAWNLFEPISNYPSLFRFKYQYIKRNKISFEFHFFVYLKYVL